MWHEHSTKIQRTLEAFETWSKTKIRPNEWQKTLDLESQRELERFAHYQIFVVRAFKILLPLKVTDQKRILECDGSEKLAKRWLIWSNTCLKYQFLPLQ